MNNTYRYKRYMRDGSVREIVAVIRSKKREKPQPTKSRS